MCGLGCGTYALEMLRSMRLVQRVETARGTEYCVTLRDDPPALDTTAPASTSVPKPLGYIISAIFTLTTWCFRANFCSSIEFQWLQRHVVHIAEHLGMQVSLELVSPACPTRNIDVDTADLGVGVDTFAILSDSDFGSESGAF